MDINVTKNTCINISDLDDETAIKLRDQLIEQYPINGKKTLDNWKDDGYYCEIPITDATEGDYCEFTVDCDLTGESAAGLVTVDVDGDLIVTKENVIAGGFDRPKFWVRINGHKALGIKTAKFYHKVDECDKFKQPDPDKIGLYRSFDGKRYIFCDGTGGRYLPYYVTGVNHGWHSWDVIKHDYEDMLPIYPCWVED